MKLQDRVAIVTGAGSGIGRAIAVLFAKEGAKVVAADFNGETAQETAKMIKDAGGESLAVTVDVSKPDDVDRMVSSAVEKFGKLDIQCNNAGIFDGFTPALDQSDELWDRVISINLKGVFLCSRRAIPEMLKQGKGAIVNTASIAGLVAGGGGISYTASKHGVVGITRALAAEFTPQGIRVNAFCPGGIATGMTNDLFKDAALKSGIESMPIGRVGQPEEMARGALFLASDDSSFSTGSLLVLDGGWTVL
jgi:NAD(P)-dependent dehydrogenase (short-subunit alcohol dehydrogenase family)